MQTEDDPFKHANMVRRLDDGRIEMTIWEDGKQLSSFLDDQDALSLSMRLIESLPVDRDIYLYKFVTEAIARKRASILMQTLMPDRFVPLRRRQFLVGMNVVYRSALSAFKIAGISLWGTAHATRLGFTAR